MSRRDAAEWSPEWDFEPEPVGVGADRARATGAASLAPRRGRPARRASAARPSRRGSVAAPHRGPTGAGGRWRRRFAAAVAMAALAAALWAINSTFQPFHGSGSGAAKVVIPPGANAGAIGDRLEQAGVIDSSFFFGLNATLTLRRGDLRDGSYLLRKGMTNGQAIEALMQDPLAGRALAPAMQNAALAAAGLAGWRYRLLPLPPHLFGETVRSLPALGFRGVNVTIPHKEAALALADEASEAARAIGAANTLTFAGGVIYADATDAPGLLEALAPVCRTAGRRALVLGAVGSARAAVWALLRPAPRSACGTRTAEHAQALAAAPSGPVPSRHPRRPTSL